MTAYNLRPRKFINYSEIEYITESESEFEEFDDELTETFFADLDDILECYLNTEQTYIWSDLIGVV